MAILIEAGTFHSNAWLCTLVRVKWIHALPNRLLLLYCSVQLSFSNITVHCFLYFLFSILLHPTHIQETCLPAGSGSAQRRLQPVRKNSHLAPHASLHHPTPLPLISPMLPPWHPSLLFPLLPSFSCHLIQITELGSVSICLRPHFAWQMDRRREDGPASSGSTVYMCVYEMDGENQRKEVEWFFSWGRGVKCQTENEVGRLLSVKPAWGRAFQATEPRGCS